MKFWKSLFYVFTVSCFLSCSAGYEKVDGDWAWVFRSEAGRHITRMEVDHASFEILNDKYAKDKLSVFWEGNALIGADPESFTILEGSKYSKDAKSVYVNNYPVIFADPGSFQALDWPYAKDKNRVYNGNLPMQVEDVAAFKVLQGSEFTTIAGKKGFIQRNQDYAWLDTLDFRTVIYSSYGKAVSKTDEFDGFRKVNED